MKYKNMILSICGGCLVMTCFYLFHGLALLIFEATSYPSLCIQIGWFIIFLISSIGIGLKFVGALE